MRPSRRRAAQLVHTSKQRLAAGNADTARAGDGKSKNSETMPPFRNSPAYKPHAYTPADPCAARMREVPDAPGANAVSGSGAGSGIGASRIIA